MALAERVPYLRYSQPRARVRRQREMIGQRGRGENDPERDFVQPINTAPLVGGKCGSMWFAAPVSPLIKSELKSGDLIIRIRAISTLGTRSSTSKFVRYFNNYVVYNYKLTAHRILNSLCDSRRTDYKTFHVVPLLDFVDEWNKSLDAYHGLINDMQLGAVPGISLEEIRARMFNKVMSEGSAPAHGSTWAFVHSMICKPKLLPCCLEYLGIVDRRSEYHIVGTTNKGGLKAEYESFSKPGACINLYLVATHKADIPHVLQGIQRTNRALGHGSNSPAQRRTREPLRERKLLRVSTVGHVRGAKRKV